MTMRGTKALRHEGTKGGRAAQLARPSVPSCLRTSVPFFPGFRGFTLVEVLAALAVIAVLLPAVLRGVSLATALASQTRQRTEAAALAKLKLDELAVTRTWRTGEMTGDFGPDWPDYRWTASTGDWMAGAARELDVTVTWTSRRGEHAMTISTLVYAETP